MGVMTVKADAARRAGIELGAAYVFRVILYPRDPRRRVEVELTGIAANMSGRLVEMRTRKSTYFVPTEDVLREAG